eukprot:TRINITY_DN4433_c0_g1_i2.p1 TRINITY_DN4433_c0_g1~~TRINITY_DN4433_c0_g1_i2.p1  ORF type:complete len:112 (-),score=17.79 TRINITY_DN4433_c0_g1_i2:63-398(-)
MCIRDSLRSPVHHRQADQVLRIRFADDACGHKACFSRAACVAVRRIVVARLPRTILSPHEVANTQHSWMFLQCYKTCLLYTSDAADDLLCVDLGGCRIIKKKKIYCIEKIE